MPIDADEVLANKVCGARVSLSPPDSGGGSDFLAGRPLVAYAGCTASLYGLFTVWWSVLRPFMGECSTKHKGNDGWV